jgi:hypothetical protein
MSRVAAIGFHLLAGGYAACNAALWQSFVQDQTGLQALLAQSGAPAGKARLQLLWLGHFKDGCGSLMGSVADATKGLALQPTFSLKGLPLNSLAGLPICHLSD